VANGEAEFSHAGFELRVASYPFAFTKAAENLAMCHGAPDIAACTVNGWIRSPAHKVNLVEVSFDVCGVGTALSKEFGEERLFVTQLFAARSNSA